MCWCAMSTTHIYSQSALNFGYFELLLEEQPQLLNDGKHWSNNMLKSEV